jgi:hypothetical protein
MESETGPEIVVELRYASLPVIGLLAVHYWFVVFDHGCGECHRWEVWQTKNAGGRAIEHVHCDLKHPDAGVGGGPMRIAAQWRGKEALSIKAVLDRAEHYPHRSRYLPWPGPNSNTFVAWVLEQASVEHRLGIRGIGRNYR